MTGAAFLVGEDWGRRDVAVALAGTQDPDWSDIYIKVVDGEPFRMGWPGKPDYSKCYCDSCKVASEHGFRARWKKSRSLVDRLGWKMSGRAGR